MQAPNVFAGINYNNPVENFGTTLPTAPVTPTVPVVGGNRTYGSYGTYVPPDQVQAVTGVGDNRTYNGFAGTGTPTTFAAPTFVTPTPQDNSGVFDPLREGLGSLFDRAKALQGQNTYVNPFLRPGG